MTHQEFIHVLNKCSEGATALMSTMKGLLLLAERYPSSPETQNQLELISKCLGELENVISEARQDLCAGQ